MKHVTKSWLSKALAMALVFVLSFATFSVPVVQGEASDELYYVYNNLEMPKEEYPDYVYEPEEYNPYEDNLEEYLPDYELANDETSETGELNSRIVALSGEQYFTEHIFSFDGDLSGAISQHGYRPFSAGGNITFAPGRFGDAAVFDGNSSIYLGTNLITSSTYTISMWINPTAFTNYTSAFFGYVFGSGGQWVSIVPSSAAGNTGFWANDTSRPYPFQWFGGQSRIPLNEWSHLVVTINGDAVTVYVNNEVVATGNNMPGILSQAGNRALILGANWFDPAFQGMIDEVRLINNGAVNAAGVAELFTTNTLSSANVAVPEEDTPTLPPGILLPNIPTRNAAGAHVWNFDGNLGGAYAIGHAGTHATLILESNERDASTVDFVYDRHGSPDGAVHLDGQMGIYLGANVIDTAAYTVAFWVRPERPDGADGPMHNSFTSMFFGGIAQGAWVSVHAATNAGGPRGLGIWSGSPYDGDPHVPWTDNFASNANRLIANEWQHVAVVVAANGSTTLYVNGISIPQVASGNLMNLFGPAANIGHFFLGTNFFPDAPFIGAISDLHIFNRALPAGEVYILYNPDMAIGTEPADAPVVPPLINGAHRWSFDVDLGGAAEVSTQPNLLNVNTSIRGNVPRVPGRIGYAAQFNGNSGLYLGDNIITGNTYTVAFWASPDRITDWTSMFFGGNSPRHLSIAPRIGWANGTGAFLVPGHQWHFSPGVIPANEWTHVALTTDGQTSRFYLNGMLTYRVNNPTDVFSGMTNGQFFLGLNLFNDLAFRGLIDELYIFPETALTTTEIRALALVELPEFIMPGANMEYVDPPAPVFGNITVHDPSLTRARVGDYYYVIGTFLGGGRSRDLIYWESINYGLGAIRNRYNNTSGHWFFPVNNPDPNVETVATQIARADADNTPDGGINFWANEIIQMPCGRLFMYYSLSAGFHSGVAQANRSGIGLAISENGMEGPWVTQGMFVASGRAAGYSAARPWGYTPDGLSAFETVIHTNAIDPSPFFDSQGNFWLVYGSWSGGIFLYEMCADTGLPIPFAESELNSRNDGFGELVHAFSGTARGGIEGPHIIFSETSGYYYLFVTTGGLGANDGYNVRILRSLRPYGPFADTRFSQVNVQPNPRQQPFIDVDDTLFNFVDIGVKILGGAHFVGAPNESHAGTAHLSPGHGGAILCPDSGRYYKVFHTRWAGRGEWHAIRVHEMFMTDAGWFVLAPLRYDGGNAVRTFTKEALVGDYKVLHHGRYVDLESNTSSLYRFNSDGVITVHADGTVAGAWALVGDNTANITLHGIDYTGVFLRQFDEDQQTWVQTFSVISDGNDRNYNGLTVWGVGLSAGEPYVVPCDICNEHPCICPILCDTCDNYPCVCPILCDTCDNYPCVCPILCNTCGNYPCECISIPWQPTPPEVQQPTPHPLPTAPPSVLPYISWSPRNVQDNEPIIVAEDADETVLIAYEEDGAPLLEIPAPPQRQLRVIRFVMDNLVYTINGTPRTNDVEPFVNQAYDRVMIPLRAVSEALGAEVQWERETRTVLITTTDGTQSLVVDLPLPDGMGTPIIVQDRVFVPLRFVAELLGAEVRWDGANRAAYVYMRN